MSHYADEQYDVYHEVRVFAVQAHECDAVMCDQPIRKGDAYWRIHVVYDGRAETIKRCVRCQTIHEHLRGLGDDMWPDERLNCGQDYREEWGTDPPADIQALAFWRAGEPLPQIHRSVFLDRHGVPRAEACRQYRGWNYGSRVDAKCVRDRGPL